MDNRLWRLTDKSVNKIITAFNMGPRQSDDLRAQSMSIQGGTKDPKRFTLRPIRFERVPRDPLEHRFNSEHEFEFRVIFEIEHGFFFPLTLRLTKEFSRANLADNTLIAGIINTMVLEIDNMTDAERVADLEAAALKAKIRLRNVVNIGVTDSGRAYKLLHQLTALGMARGFEAMVCYIPRSVAVRCDTAYLRLLCNVEVYETESRLGDAYRGKTMEQTIILECLGDGNDQKTIEAVDHLVRTMSAATKTEEGIVYRITLREESDHA